MEKKSDSVFNWVLYNIIVVIVPVFTCLLLSSLYNRKIPSTDDILNNIILILLSILCSLLSVSNENKFNKKIYRFTFSLTFIIWSIYLIFLMGFIPYDIYPIIICILLICICSCLGVKTIKKNCDIENERISNMHKNCCEIRNTMFRNDYDGCLESHANRENDLLCDPDKFDRIQKSIENFVKNKK